MAAQDSHPQTATFGGHLKFWRNARSLTQLELANRAATTTRHVSFMETGRSRPGQSMVLRLTEALQVPKRDCNDLLKSAGYPGIFRESSLTSDTMVPFRRAIRYSVAAHEPFPSFAINRWYDILEKNEAAHAMFGSHGPDKKMNIINSIFEDPDMRDRLDNWGIVARGIACRLRREASSAPHDQRLQDLLQLAHQAMEETSTDKYTSSDDLIICPTFRIGGQLIHTISMVARFGSTRDILADELRVETIFPRDAEAEAFFLALANTESPGQSGWCKDACELTPQA